MYLRVQGMVGKNGYGRGMGLRNYKPDKIG
jgi:hypothetical protein